MKFRRLVLLPFFVLCAQFLFAGSIHDKSKDHQGEDLAWTIQVDETQRTLTIQTIFHKLEIVVKPEADFEIFSRGSVVPIDFSPLQFSSSKEKQDYPSEPFSFSVAKKPARIISWRFLSDTPSAFRILRRVDSRHGDLFILEGLIGKDALSLVLWCGNPNEFSKIKKMKPGDSVDVRFPENTPYKATIQGAVADIISIHF